MPNVDHTKEAKGNPDPSMKVQHIFAWVFLDLKLYVDTPSHDLNAKCKECNV